MAKPVKVWRDKGVDVAVWQNERGYMITHRKTFKDKTTGEFRESKNFFVSEVPVLVDLLQQAMRWIELNQTPAANDDVPF